MIMNLSKKTYDFEYSVVSILETTASDKRITKFLKGSMQFQKIKLKKRYLMNTINSTSNKELNLILIRW